MIYNESKWDEDMVLSADEQDDLEDAAAAWNTETTVAEFNEAIEEATSLEIDPERR